MSDTKKLTTNEKDSQKKDIPTNIKVRKFVISALCGYVAGVLITVLWFTFLTMQLNLPLKKSTYVTCVIASIFTLGLAYNRNVRCLTLLSLPIFCSAKGRSAIMTFAFMLAVTGPCVNIMKNVDELSKSMSCGQEQLKDAMQNMLDVMKAPLVAIKNALNMAMDEIKKVMSEVEIVLKQIQELIKLLLKSITKAFSWLGSIVSVCNKEVGTPFARCMKIASETMEDCNKKMGIMKSLCNVTKIFEGLCYSVKFLDVICVLVDFISDTIVKTVAEKLAEFNESVKKFFYVSVTFDHDFYFKTTSSQDLSDVGKKILEDIRLRQKNLFFIFGWLDFLAFFVFIIIILKTLHYKHKFLSNNRFDNRYITKDFELIDKRRKEMDKETVLPLTRKEKNRYVRLTSCALTEPECRKMARSLIFLIISCIQMFVICFVDYSLYMLLEIIRYNGRKQAGLEVPPYMTVKVEGGGFIGDIYRGLAKAFEPVADKYETDVTECLPDPKIPNYSRYYLIGGLVSLAWLFVLIQPYVLRLRPYVMGIFYPEENRQRSVWLHNQVLLRRTSFLKFARRAARRVFSNKNTHDKDTLLDLIRAKTNNCWIARKILGSGESNRCILCATSLKGRTDTSKCANIGCKGLYCGECYKELNKSCFLCKSPLEYGDDSDYSEEKDSSYELQEVKVTTTNEAASKIPSANSDLESGQSSADPESGDVASNKTDNETDNKTDNQTDKKTDNNLSESSDGKIDDDREMKKKRGLFRKSLKSKRKKSKPESSAKTNTEVSSLISPSDAKAETTDDKEHESSPDTDQPSQDKIKGILKKPSTSFK